jgi:hypothetical protein
MKHLKPKEFNQIDVKIMFKNAVSGHLIIFCIKISGTVW